jgi:nucleoside 2-deoxyribosyltransferase
MHVMRRLRCFVACAFGEKEVDAIYEKGIRAALKSCEVQALRVDRVEHNDDIDDKIIELLDTSDLCIADLTFARPSVYYEAGYFTGLGKPVIYTARKDHFRPSADDVAGNRRIHFDLQMKNIIDWTSTTRTKTFRNRVGSRIRHVSAPILRALEAHESQTRAVQEFRMLSANQRLQRIDDIASKLLVANGWKIQAQTQRPDYSMADPIKVFASQDRLIALYLTQSATLSYLGRIFAFHQSSILRNAFPNSSIHHFLFVSVRPIPATRIDDRYPKIELVPGSEMSFRDPSADREPRYLHFASGINSELAARNRLDTVLQIIDAI